MYDKDIFYIVLYSVFRQMVRLPGFTPAQTHCPGAKARGIKATSTKRTSMKRASINGLALTLALVMAGCATSPDTVVEPEPKESPSVVTPDPKEQSPVVEAPPAKDPVPTQPNSAQNDKPQTSGEMVTVQVYTIDDQCNNFVSEPIQVPNDKAISEAVGKSMTAVDYNAFKLAGYQVSVTGSTAVVDMELAPGSERKFVSLSSCEQRSLFGGIEETLLNNDAWNVTAVKFTNKGKEIIL